jgi:hypothetical protein
MNNDTRSRAPGGTRPPQSAQTLGGSVGTAVDSAVNAMEEAVDRGKAMASDAGVAASGHHSGGSDRGGPHWIDCGKPQLIGHRASASRRSLSPIALISMRGQLHCGCRHSATLSWNLARRGRDASRHMPLGPGHNRLKKVAFWERDICVFVASRRQRTYDSYSYGRG